ncbi:MAG: hypothetical protein KF781_06775 [Chitinophagaceae bacterium]|nr:hypothetical protein [Chitinophagaceae bacterium]MCW5904075.1 hypothetical protein [Chitinophagaceae bacterium]
MKSTFKIICLLLIIGQLTLSNMASPIREGTSTATAITSKNIHIVSENIYVKIDNHFTTAKYIVEYHIQVDTAGAQIPLLFYAKDYRDSFKIWLDNESIEVFNVYEHLDNTLSTNFPSYFTKEAEEFSISWKENNNMHYNIQDLKYFKTDISKGTHTVKVEYIANAWSNVSDWITQYSFRYSLTPAKYWKSFRGLTITIEQAGALKKINTNLGQPNENEIKNINTWTFDKLPNEDFIINYTPEVSKLATTLIAIEPFGLAIIAFILLIAIHLYFTLRYRRSNLNKKYSLAVFIGCLLVPMLTVIVYVNSYDLIDTAIGINAGKHHGYFFMYALIFFFPVMFILYLFIFWLIDKLYKRKLLHSLKQ